MIPLLLAPAASGALIAGLDGTQNTTSPANFAYWNNLGYRPYTSDTVLGTGIYLGDGWVLTAQHVQVGDNDGYTLVIPKLNNGQDAVFYPQFASQRQLRFPGTALGSDLAVFRLQDDPLLQTLPKVQFGSTPQVGAQTTVFGFGYNRDPTLHYWRLADPTHPDSTTWTDVTGKPTQFLAQREGYYYAAGFAKRWGANATVAMEGGGPTFTYTAKDANGNISSVTELLGSTFDANITNEAQLAPGDSGGGVFVGNRLVGLNLYKGDFSNDNGSGQPSNTAVSGNSSFYADLFTYVDELTSITKLHPSIDGDANLDGLVDSDDFKIFYDNFGIGTHWTQGDFNLDGLVDFKDFQRLELNFGKSSFSAESSEIVAPVAAAVPEPSALTVLAAGAIRLFARRRRP